MSASPTLGQLKAQVKAIRQRRPDSRVIGIRSASRWTGPAEAADDEGTYVIRQCDSPLAMRVALREAVSPNTTKILVTPLEQNELGDDILLRLAKRRLWQIDTWQIVRSLFQAQAVDPRLTRLGWIADRLLDQVSAEGYPAARGGFLDADTVWGLLLRQQVGLEADPPDLTSLLKWSLDADGTARFRQAGESFQQAAMEWLADRAGPVAGLVCQSLTRLDRPDAVPLGLALGVVFHPEALGRLEKATGKLEERYLGGQTPDTRAMLRWSAAAIEVVRGLRHTETRLHWQTLQRADDLLAEIGAAEWARLSDTSPLGYNQRLARFGTCLAETVASQRWGDRQTLQDALQSVRAHDLAQADRRRVERAEMALRLVRWLAERTGRETPEASLAAAADRHLHDGGFVDWARFRLAGGDGVRELSEAYASLFLAVRTVRERDARRFAQLLVDSTANGQPPADVVPVERILDEFVAPVAADFPVLVIVIDGLSVGVCRQLLDECTRHEWVSLSEPGRPANRPGLAVLPSKTEFSRTSLLAGRLLQGGQFEEQTGFAQHPALLARSKTGYPPVLFHKVDLQEATDNMLANEVRREIASTHRKIVGVVVNAVDDHLLKGDQIDIDWSPEHIKVLPALLHEARLARRKVILVSDHGHVLDYQTEGRLGDGGERWRPATGPLADDELQVTGPRVMTPGHTLIAPWSERVRYTAKKNGYHGGLNPQEMVVPVMVLSSHDDLPAGWEEQPTEVPPWWDEPLPLATSEVRPNPAGKTTPPRRRPGVLFTDDAVDQARGRAPAVPPAATAGAAAPATAAAGSAGTTGDTTAGTAAVPAWIDRLLKSPVLDQQKRLAGRNVPPDEQLGRLLAILEARGGKLTTVALARALAFPELRLPGLLAKIQRLLNVDGYAVLNRDDTSETVELNRELLLKQFDLREV